MFRPPRCPWTTCRYHRRPPRNFCIGHGSYVARCRSHPVPRFLCRACGRSFSRQTFRADYFQKKPHLNAAFLQLMVACVGQRQAARALGTARRTVEHRFQWLARHAGGFQDNRLNRATLVGPFQLDELESFEANRYQPVTVPVLIDRRTLFVIATAVGPLRRKGRMRPEQKRRRAAHEAQHGRRPTRSDAVVRRVLARLRRAAAPQAAVVLDSDQKPSYGRIGRALFGTRFRWRPHPARARRDTSNPLFPINHTNARLRHYLSRLRRRTWCVSKRGSRLQGHLQIAALWANYCRGITNKTRTSPAQALGLAPRAYRAEEVLGWREDWGARSPGRRM
jgi:transposase-like protein/IS1 family transposase